MPYTLRDFEGKVLIEETFYWSDNRKNITLFTGKYDSNNHALFESPDGPFTIDSNTARTTLHPIHDPQHYLEKKLAVIDWIEGKLTLNPQTQEELPPAGHIFMGPQGDLGPFGKHPHKHDDGYVHPNKRY